MTNEEYTALSLEPMTQERYEALAAQYGFEAIVRVGEYRTGCYDYATYGKTPQYRIYQLRAIERLRERESAQTAADEARLRERQAASIAAYNAAVVEEYRHDRGY
jgi:hypothetical protein